MEFLHVTDSTRPRIESGFGGLSRKTLTRRTGRSTGARKGGLAKAKWSGCWGHPLPILIFDLNPLS